MSIISNKDVISYRKRQLLSPSIKSLIESYVRFSIPFSFWMNQFSIFVIVGFQPYQSRIFHTSTVSCRSVLKNWKEIARKAIFQCFVILFRYKIPVLSLFHITLKFLRSIFTWHLSHQQQRWRQFSCNHVTKHQISWLLHCTLLLIK